MKIFVEKFNNSLHPTEGYDFDKLKNGQTYEVSVKKYRNIRFHRKFYGLLNKLYDAVHPEYDIDTLRKIFTMRAGFYDRVVTKKGETYLPKSIAFEKMDEIEFNDFYTRFNKELKEEFGVDLNDVEYEH